MNKTKIGIDAGGTLTKVAYFLNGTLIYHKFPSDKMDAVVTWMNEQSTELEICTTGGKAVYLNTMINRDVQSMVEFDATCEGVKYLLEQDGKSLDLFILTNVGTGTSIHILNKDNHSRVGGTGVGGGTILGLSTLLTGIEDYHEIIDLAVQGNRDLIDLKVSQIYEGSKSPISGELTASNFGQVQKGLTSERNQADLLSAIMGMVGETVSTISVHAAAQHGASNIVYIGSSFSDNQCLREITENYTRLRGANPTFVENGEFSGAIGALLSLQKSRVFESEGNE